MNSSDHSESLLGRLIGDRNRYRLEKYLGGGGMGDVFLATDTLLGKQVALKLLKGMLINTEAFSKRFNREVSLSAALKSDHIVQVSDYGMTAEGDPFYVMEYLEGETLGQRLVRQGRLSASQAIGIMVQICKGLQIAHEGINVWQKGAASSTKSRIVHRDLKPENIFLVPTVLGDLVKIIDFGIAKIYNEQKAQQTNLSVANQFIGTFRYASPEQWESSEELDGRSDIYSLGIILYEMLSGVDPFDSHAHQSNAFSLAFWARAHTQLPPRPLRSQPGCEDISPELEAVVLRCLEKSPDHRFATVTDLGRSIVQVAVDDNLPLNISITESSHLAATNITDAETIVSQINPSIAETVFPSTPLEAIEPTVNVFSSELRFAKPTYEDTPRSNQLANQLVNQQPNQIDQEKTVVSPDHGNSTHKPPLRNILAIGAGIVALITGVFYVSWHGQTDNGIANLNELRSLSVLPKYEECIAKANTLSSAVAKDKSAFAETQAILHKCRFEHAQQLVALNRLDAGLAHISQIPKDSPLYSEAQQLAQRWSEQTIALAAPKYQNGDFKAAIALLETIPPTSPTHTKAQTAIANWKKEWQTAETQFNAAQLALKNNKPQVALDAANKVPKITFWRNKIKPIIDDANARIARSNQPAIVNPSNTSPATVNTSPAQVPDSTANVERQQPAVAPPPEPERNPVVAPPPSRTWEDEPSSNQNNSNQNNDSGGI